jgi:hypothetical protein
MHRFGFVALLMLVGCGDDARSSSESSIIANPVNVDGAEEQKLLRGEPSMGFLPKDVDIVAVRAKLGVNAVSPGVLVWDAKSGPTPPNWRATDAIDPSLVSAGINTQGLDQLHIAGSGMFDKHQFETVRRLAQTLQRPLFVLALRQEPTGFIGDQPFSMYGFADRSVNDWSNPGLNDDESNARNDAILDATSRANPARSAFYRTHDYSCFGPFIRMPNNTRMGRG